MTHAGRRRARHRHPRHRREEPGRDRPLAVEPQADGRDGRPSSSSGTASRVLGFDVVFAERDPSSGIETLDALAQGELKQTAAFQQAYRELRPKLDGDALFAAAMKGRPVVLGYYFNSEEKAVRANALPEPVLPKGAFAGRDVAFYRWSGLHRQPGRSTSRTRAGAGHFNPAPDNGRHLAARADAARVRRRVLRAALARRAARLHRAADRQRSRRSAPAIPRATARWSGCRSGPTPSPSTSTRPRSFPIAGRGRSSTSRSPMWSRTASRPAR